MPRSCREDYQAAFVDSSHDQANSTMLQANKTGGSIMPGVVQPNGGTFRTPLVRLCAACRQGLRQKLGWGGKDTAIVVAVST